MVGPRGMYPNFTHELTNLSGIKHLTSLESLFITHGALTSLDGIEHLQNLKALFCNSNKITDIRAVHYLKNLTQFYCNANQVNSILPLKNLTSLEVIYCNYNQLRNFYGLTQEHKTNLKEFFGLPNDLVKPKEIKRVEEGLEIKCLKS